MLIVMRPDAMAHGIERVNDESRRVDEFQGLKGDGLQRRAAIVAGADGLIVE
jgi:hypothetical protein